MKQLIVVWLCVLASAVAQDPVGDWLGKLDVGGGLTLRLVLHVARDANGLHATVDSIDQHANGLKVDEFTCAGSDVRLVMHDLGASFAGTFTADGAAIDGAWHQAKRLPLRFERSAAPPVLARPQVPKPPLPYDEVAVTVDVPATDRALQHTLAGTLTLPRSARPHAAVVLITGSGPQDRDEALLGHQPFLVLADHLTRHGFAVLRCDDRGVGGSTGTFQGCTSADFAADVRAMVAFLCTRADIDARRIGLCGHSEGGLIAPLVAADADSGVAFCVLLAGPGVRGRELLLLQQERIARAGGTGDDEVALTRRHMGELFDIAIAVADASERTQRLRTAAERMWQELTPEQRAASGDHDTVLAGVMEIDTPWMRWFLAYDPAPTVRRLRCPVLALNGAKDLQVDAAQNLTALRAALTAGGNPDFECVELPGLNHLFQTCATGAPSEYAAIEETLAPAALQRLTDWLVARFATPAKR